MSVRTILALRRGEPPVEIRTEAGPLGFGDRVRALRASAAEQLAGGIDVEIARVVCDGCGATAELDAHDPQLPAGWAARPDGEFCQECR